MKKRKKLSLETRRKMSDSKKGNKNPLFGKGPMFGKKHSFKTKEKQSLSKIGKKRPDLMGEKNHFFGKKYTMEERLRKSISSRGSLSVAWKGGVTKLGTSIRTSFEYRQWRSDVFFRDNFTCLGCGKRGGFLEAHHLKSFSLIMKENNIKSREEAIACSELWNINNGRTLCKECHKKTDNYLWHNLQRKNL